VFFIIHFLLYPASNGYNSYFDKDEKSIGGLKNPPPVNKGLYYLALCLDGLALLLGILKINVLFAFMLLIYGLVSKAYSHPAVRLKKYPITGWIVTGLFQGLFTFAMCYVGLNKYPVENLLKPEVLIPGALTTVMLWANYPMTQIYQHDEDAKRGDRTISLILGVRGTFYFVGGVFSLVTVGFILYFIKFFALIYAIAFLIALLPVVVYFSYWFIAAYKDESKADHRHTMRLNFISATCLNVFFIYLFLSSTHVLQIF
jgi:1,4-dihydroxy-2-naphthoate octaprenyltransferase